MRIHRETETPLHHLSPSLVDAGPITNDRSYLKAKETDNREVRGLFTVTHMVYYGMEL